jgi:hypothetical protein
VIAALNLSAPSLLAIEVVARLASDVQSSVRIAMDRVMKATIGVEVLEKRLEFKIQVLFQCNTSK